jgi:hypothetical protein
MRTTPRRIPEAVHWYKKGNLVLKMAHASLKYHSRFMADVHRLLYFGAVGFPTDKDANRE